jgi:hypothetical protein
LQPEGHRVPRAVGPPVVHAALSSMRRRPEPSACAMVCAPLWLPRPIALARSPELSRYSGYSRSVSSSLDLGLPHSAVLAGLDCAACARWRCAHPSVPQSRTLCCERTPGLVQPPPTSISCPALCPLRLSRSLTVSTRLPSLP